jgi:DNA-directed RNA polymerase alpha subunit
MTVPHPAPNPKPVVGPLGLERTTLSMRAQNALRNDNITTVQDLRACLALEESPVHYLSQLPNVGARTAREIIDYLYAPEAHQRLLVEQRCVEERWRIKYYAKLSQDAETKLAELEAELKQQEQRK